MADQSWFRHWAKESLLSDDLDELTDHEERVWWRLLSVASLNDPRWQVDITARLAAKCKSTPAKMAKAITTFERRGMIDYDRVEQVVIRNAAKWNEDKNDRPPSSTKEAVRKRKADQRERDRLRDLERDMSQEVTNDGHVTSHDHKEVEIEEEEDPEKEKKRSEPTRRHKPITEDWLDEIQPAHPTVDVREVLRDAENRKTWDGYKDKRRSLLKYIGWAEEKVTTRVMNSSSRNGTRPPTGSEVPGWRPSNMLSFGDGD